MTEATVHRIFEVDAPLAEAWHRLAEVERWPEWAPHIVSVIVSPPGELGSTSSRAFKIKRLGRNSFRMSAWEPLVRWEWAGGFPGVRHLLRSPVRCIDPTTTRLEWLVELLDNSRPSYEASSPASTVATWTELSRDSKSGSARSRTRPRHGEPP